MAAGSGMATTEQVIRSATDGVGSSQLTSADLLIYTE